VLSFSETKLRFSYISCEKGTVSHQKEQMNERIFKMSRAWKYTKNVFGVKWFFLKRVRLVPSDQLPLLFL